MAWYWAALLLGAVVAPWVLNATAIRIAFEEQGMVGGFGVWFGNAFLTTPVVFIGFWLGELFLG